jgi:hypothetical protein
MGNESAVPRQAHAVDAYSRCAVLLATDSSIVCAGSEGLETLWQNTTQHERALGVAFAEVGGTPLVLALLDPNRLLTLEGQLFVLGPGTPAEVLNAFAASRWVSFAALEQDVVSLEMDTDGRMKVESYVLRHSASGSLEILPRTTASWHVFGDEDASVTFEVSGAGETVATEDAWLRFSRVVATPMSLHAVAVAVREQLGVLQVMACAVPRAPLSSAEASSGFARAPSWRAG